MCKKVYEKVGKELNIPTSQVEMLYKAYWKAVKNYIESLPLDKNLSEEEFNALKTSVNIPSLGKFYIPYNKYKRIKAFENENTKQNNL